MSANSAEIGLYADALLALGRAGGDLPAIEEEIAEALAEIGRNAEIGRFVADPCVTTDGKVEAFKEILGGRASNVVILFLQLLLENGRFSNLEQIASSFFDKCSNLKNQRSGELVSALPMTDEQVRAVEKESGRILGYDVQLRNKTDSSLLGGFLVRVGDFSIDNTLDRYLDVIRSDLAE